MNDNLGTVVLLGCLLLLCVRNLFEDEGWEGQTKVNINSQKKNYIWVDDIYLNTWGYFDHMYVYVKLHGFNYFMHKRRQWYCLLAFARESKAFIYFGIWHNGETVSIIIMPHSKNVSLTCVWGEVWKWNYRSKTVSINIVLKFCKNEWYNKNIKFLKFTVNIKMYK